MILLSENAVILKDILNQYNYRQQELKSLLLEGNYNSMSYKTTFHTVSILSSRVINGCEYNYKTEYIQKSKWLFVLNYYYDYSKGYIKLDRDSFVSDIIKGELLNLDGLYSDKFLISAYSFYQWVKLKFKHEPKYIELVTGKQPRLESFKELVESKQIKVTKINDIDTIELFS